MLGSGVNQEIYAPGNISPPMINNFFNVAYRINSRFNDYDDKLEQVYKYIKKFWRKEKQDLRNCKFDLEECFTLLQLQLYEAVEEGNLTEFENLDTVQRILLSFFIEVMNEFQHHIDESEIFLNFGKILLMQQPHIITFNYDVFVEKAIEIASGRNSPHRYVQEFQEKLTEVELGLCSQNSEWKWNMPLAYDLRFDEIQLRDGSIGNHEKYISGKIFYKNNIQYHSKILKLHGSINWYTYVNDSPNFRYDKDTIERMYTARKDQLIMQDPVWFLPMSDLPWHRNQLFIRPMITTPIMYKQFSSDNVTKKVYGNQWNKSKELLSKCKKLIIIGYSFPTTDFYSKKLILESTYDNILSELTIVNPDSNTVKYIQNLIPHKKLTIFCDLKDFVTNSENAIADQMRHNKQE